LKKKEQRREIDGWLVEKEKSQSGRGDKCREINLR
jgi:hypothetical protein